MANADVLHSSKSITSGCDQETTCCSGQTTCGSVFRYTQIGCKQDRIDKLNHIMIDQLGQRSQRTPYPPGGPSGLDAFEPNMMFVEMAFQPSPVGRHTRIMAQGQQTIAQTRCRRANSPNNNTSFSNFARRRRFSVHTTMPALLLNTATSNAKAVHNRTHHAKPGIHNRGRQ